MNPRRMNIVLGILLALSVIFGLYQSFALKRLRASLGHPASYEMLVAGSTDSGTPADGTVNRGLLSGAGSNSSDDSPGGAAGVDARSLDKNDSSTRTEDGVQGSGSRTKSGKTASGEKKSASTNAAADSLLGMLLSTYQNTGGAHAPTTSKSSPGPSGRRGGSRTSGTATSTGTQSRTTGEVNPSLSNSLVIRAQDLMQSGQFESAEEALYQSLEANEANRTAWQQLAMLQHKQGFTDAEINTYLQWMERTPDDTTPYYQLASTYARLGRDNEAYHYLSQYESRASRDVHTYSQTASLYRQLDDREQEGRVLAQWLSATPESTSAQQAWADYNRRLGSYDVALAQYENLASVMPDNPMPYRQMGDIYRRMGDYTAAQNEYETALSLRPADIDILGRVAEMRLQSGNTQGALNAYSEIITLEPGSHAAESAQRRIQTLEQQIAAQQYPQGN